MSEAPTLATDQAQRYNVTRYKHCDVCDQTFDTHIQDDVFHHGPEPHASRDASVHASPIADAAPASHVDRFKRCDVCGQTFNTEVQDDVFHHGPEPHAMRSKLSERPADSLARPPTS